MEAKKKAKELVDKFINHTHESCKLEAKQCALIAVDEIIDNEKIDNLEDNNLSYWQEVKSEIEKLQ
jgi:hypothetical protein